MPASACAASTGSLVPCLHPARLPPPALCRDLRAIHFGAGRKGSAEQLRAGKRIAALSLGVCGSDVAKSSGWRAAVWGEGSCEDRIEGVGGRAGCCQGHGPWFAPRQSGTTVNEWKGGRGWWRTKPGLSPDAILR